MALDCSTEGLPHKERKPTPLQAVQDRAEGERESGSRSDIIKISSKIDENKPLTMEQIREQRSNGIKPGMMIRETDVLSVSLDLFEICESEGISWEINPVMDQDGNTLLHLLLMRREWDRVTSLLQVMRYNKHVSFMNDTNRRKSSALGICAALRDREMLATMIGNGCDISTGTRDSSEWQIRNDNEFTILNYSDWKQRCFADTRQFSKNEGIPSIGDSTVSVTSSAGTNSVCKHCRLSPLLVFQKTIKEDTLIRGDGFFLDPLKQQSVNKVVCFYQFRDENLFICHACFVRIRVMKESEPRLFEYLGLGRKSTLDEWLVAAWEEGKAMKHQCLNLDAMMEELNRLTWMPIEISRIIVGFCESEPTCFENESFEKKKPCCECVLL